ncbi:MAG TPA: hypothetical protein VFZ21_05190, partial [Gemmatimonadaceae bacterium]|nr:hypothetical protein [Gemmatimonadaceae bacterium]
MTGDRERRSLGDRAYQLLLWLYPRDFRERFGSDMTDFFCDRRRASARRGALGVAGVWARAIADVLSGATLERVEAVAQRLRAIRDAWTPSIDPSLDARNENMLATLTGDIRYALRGMAAKRAFSAVVLATLALGIGANVAIFSVVNGVLLRPLPYPDVERVVHVTHQSPHSSVSEPEFVDYRDMTTKFERLAAFATATGTLTGDGEPERIAVGRVSD